MAETTSVQVLQESPEIEQARIQLLNDARAQVARGLTPVDFQTAGFSDFQQRALDQGLSQQNNFQPFLNRAAAGLQSGQLSANRVMPGAQRFQDQGASRFQQAALQIPVQQALLAQRQAAAQQYGLNQTGLAQQGLGAAARGAQNIAQANLANQGAISGQIPGQIGAAQGAMGAASGLGLNTAAAANAAQAPILGQLGQQLGSATQEARQAAQDTSAGGISAYEQALQGSQGAVRNARNITADAASALQRAGALGESSALSGIAQLGQTTGEFDPGRAGAFMNEFEDKAVQQALADVARAGDIQQQSVAAQAVGAGAFGGSRQAVAEQELARNVLEQQGRTAAQMRQAGFESASARAQEAFERQQGRAQQAATSTGALGAQGSSSVANAAQSAGALGLDAERLASGQFLQGGQLGLGAQQAANQQRLAAEQLAASNAQSLAQTGLSFEQLQAQTGINAAQLAGQLGLQSGQLGLQGLRSQADIDNRAAALGITSQELAARSAQQQGALGQNQAQLQQTGAGQQAQLGLQGAQQLAAIGQGLGALGTDYGRLGLNTAQTQGQLATQQGALAEGTQTLGQKQTGFLFDLGRQQQQQQQAQFDTSRQNEMQQRFNPMQQLGYLSDIYSKTPSSQMSFSQNLSPGPSVGQQALGFGISGLSAASGAARAGLF